MGWMVSLPPDWRVEVLIPSASDGGCIWEIVKEKHYSRHLLKSAKVDFNSGELSW